MKISHCLAVLAIVAGLIVLTDLAAAKKTLKVKTTVKDFVTTKWTIDCPDGTTLDLGKVSMTEDGWWELTDCLNDIESENGLSISSKTVVKNSVVKSDEVNSETELTIEQAAKLCKIVEDNPILYAPTIRSRPAIRTVLRNGTVETLLIDLGDGRVIDVTALDLDEQHLQQLLQMIADLEQQNGVHVTSATGTRGGQVEGDRVISLTHLTAEQVEGLLMWFASNRIAIPPETGVLPVRTTALIKVNGQKVKVDLEGGMVIRTQPAPEPNTFEVEIVGMELRGESNAGPVVVRVDPGRPAGGKLGPVGQGAKKGKLELGLDLQVEIQNLEFGAQTQSPARVTGKFPFRPKGGTVRMKVRGKQSLVVPSKRDKPPSIKLKKFLFELPMRVEVIPDGIPEEPR